MTLFIYVETMATRIPMHDRSSPPGLTSDRRIADSGYEKCLQCGRCTASCPAAYVFGDYSPRLVMNRLSLGNVASLEGLVWRCGQCYACSARCPRNNSAGLGVLALREHFLQKKVPEKLRAISALLLGNLYERGETFVPGMLSDELLREFGPETYRRCSANREKRVLLGYGRDDARERRVPAEALAEIRVILAATGCGETRE